MADSVRSIRTSTKSGPHRIYAGMFKAKHFLSQPVFTVLSIVGTRYNNYTLPIYINNKSEQAIRSILVNA